MAGKKPVDTATGGSSILDKAPRFVWYGVTAILAALAVKVVMSDQVSFDWSTMSLSASAKEREAISKEREQLERMRDDLHASDIARTKAEMLLGFCQERQQEYLQKISVIENQARSCTAQNPGLSAAINQARDLKAPPAALKGLNLELKPMSDLLKSRGGDTPRVQLKSPQELNMVAPQR